MNVYATVQCYLGHIQRQAVCVDHRSVIWTAQPILGSASQPPPPTGAAGCGCLERRLVLDHRVLPEGVAQPCVVVRSPAAYLCIVVSAHLSVAVCVLITRRYSGPKSPSCRLRSGLFGATSTGHRSECGRTDGPRCGGSSPELWPESASAHSDLEDRHSLTQRDRDAASSCAGGTDSQSELSGAESSEILGSRPVPPSDPQYNFPCSGPPVAAKRITRHGRCQDVETRLHNQDQPATWRMSTWAQPWQCDSNDMVGSEHRVEHIGREGWSED